MAKSEKGSCNKSNRTAWIMIILAILHVAVNIWFLFLLREQSYLFIFAIIAILGGIYIGVRGIQKLKK